MSLTGLFNNDTDVEGATATEASMEAFTTSMRWMNEVLPDEEVGAPATGTSSLPSSCLRDNPTNSVEGREEAGASSLQDGEVVKSTKSHAGE